jgi:hypothetical protein
MVVWLVQEKLACGDKCFRSISWRAFFTSPRRSSTKFSNRANDGARPLIVNAGQIDLPDWIEQDVDPRGFGGVLTSRIPLVWLTARSARSAATHPLDLKMGAALCPEKNHKDLLMFP